MAQWTKIEDGMPEGGTAIQAALEAINKETVATTTRKLAASDIADKTKVSEIDGGISRDGRLVHLSMHYSTNAGANTTSASALVNVMTVPEGYRPAGAGQEALTIEQSAASSNTRAYAGGAPCIISAHGADGGASVSGTWITNDDFPD